MRGFGGATGSKRWNGCWRPSRELARPSKRCPSWITAPGLSATTLTLAAAPDQPPLALLRYTNRQRRAFENLRFVLEEGLAELVAFHFDRAGWAVTRTGDGEEALILAEEIRPDLVLLDWMIEGISGIEVCRRLRRREATANLPIIMLTARGEEEDRIRGLETGADDYMTKPFSPKELLARAGAVLRRVRPAIAAQALSYAGLEMDLAAHRVKRDGSALSVGPTEYRLLRHFLENPSRVFSRQQLLEAVWPHSEEIELRTVDVHVRRLRQALGEPDLVRTVRSAGYALDAEGLA